MIHGGGKRDVADRYPTALVYSCPQCNDGDHEQCQITVLDAVRQWAACACSCGGGLEAWRGDGA